MLGSIEKFIVLITPMPGPGRDRQRAGPEMADKAVGQFPFLIPSQI